MKKFIVFGLGISGNAAVKFLLEQGFEVLAGDENLIAIRNLDKYLEGYPNLKTHLKIIDNIQTIDWQNTECLVLAAGIPLKYPTPHKIVLEANKNNCPIVCDVEILCQFNQQNKFIGITGTNGKSTTTALTGHIFESANKPSAVGGNIGIGALALPKLQQGKSYISRLIEICKKLIVKNKKHTKTNDLVYIIEMSSYQLDLIDQARFKIANLLNITPDHLDRHHDMAGYIAVKKRIFLNQIKGDFAVIGIDNENSCAIYQELKNDPNFTATLIPISTKNIVDGGLAMIDDVIYNQIKGNKSVIDLGIRQFLKGEHNAQNIAFAFANCFLSGIEEEKIITAIKTFKGLKHRMQLVGKIADINFINDSKATNAQSTENALKSYDNIFWIVGGKAKDGGIESLEPYFSKIKYAFLIGNASDEFAKTLENKVVYFKCADLKNAFEIALKKASQSDCGIKNILLSPACASFDQWKNFEQRGDFFCELVNKASALR